MNCMALDDILEAAEKEIKAEGLLRQYEEKPYINPARAIVELDGGKEVLEEVGEEAFADLTPAKMYNLLGGLQAKSTKELVEKARGNFYEMLDSVRDYISLASQIKPIEGDDVDDDIKKKHEKLLDAEEALKNPQKGMGKILKEYSESDSLIAQAASILIGNNPTIGKRVLYKRMEKYGAEFNDALVGDKDNATAYFSSLYNSADDKGKDEIVYRLGRHLFLEKAQEEKED